MTDNGKFGSTYCAKKVSLDGEEMANPFGNGGGMYGDAGAAAAMLDDFEPFDCDNEEEAGASGPPGVQ